MEFAEECHIDRECIIDQSVAAVRAAFEKYKDDVYMTSRIYRLVCSQLPAMLENIDGAPGTRIGADDGARRFRRRLPRALPLLLLRQDRPVLLL
jgi:hypothetical protein